MKDMQSDSYTDKRLEFLKQIFPEVSEKLSKMTPMSQNRNTDNFGSSINSQNLGSNIYNNSPQINPRANRETKHKLS